VDGAAHAYRDMGDIPRRQSELLRVPYTQGIGVDREVEAVGYQAHHPTGDEHPPIMLGQSGESSESDGVIGVVWVYMPTDPGASDEMAEQGRIGSDYGTFFTQG
jgi:glutathione-independent formaldehyde dehydrogenase